MHAYIYIYTHILALVCHICGGVTSTLAVFLIPAIFFFCATILRPPLRCLESKGNSFSLSRCPLIKPLSLWPEFLQAELRHRKGQENRTSELFFFFFLWCLRPWRQDREASQVSTFSASSAFSPGFMFATTYLPSSTPSLWASPQPYLNGFWLSA